MRFARALLLLPLLALPACGDNTVENTVTEIQEVCASPSGDEIEFTVQFATCLSSSCDTLVSSQCEVTGGPNDWVVTGEAVIRSKSGPYVACTDDCGFVSAQCTATLAGGSHTVDAGAEPLSFDVPLDAEVCGGF